MESFLILILVSFCLPSCVPQGVFTVDRRIFRPSSSDRIQTSQDEFTNLHGSASKSCAQYNKSYCSDQNCASCKCDFGYTFFDLKDGCLNAEQIYAKNTQAVSCKFGFSIFTSKTSVPTVINGGDFYSFPKQISWSPLTTAQPFSLQSTVNNVRCRAGKISYVDRHGELATFYENGNVDAFEVQDTSISTSWFSSERSYFHQLRWNQAGSVLWDKMRGKLIRLHVTCQRSNPPFLVDSCILMRVSGKGAEVLPTGNPNGHLKTTPAVTQLPGTSSQTNGTVALTKKKKSSFPAMTLAIGITVGLLLIAFLVVLVLVIRNRKNRKRDREGNSSTLPSSSNKPSSSADHKSLPNGGNMYSQRCYEEIMEIQPSLENSKRTDVLIPLTQTNGTQRPADNEPLNVYAECGDENMTLNPAEPLYIESANPYYRPSDEVSQPARADLESENPYYTPSVPEPSAPVERSPPPEYEDINSDNPLYTPMSFA